MARPSGQLVSVLLLAALAAASYWLEQRSHTEVLAPTGHAGDDFTAAQVQVDQYLPEGALQYHLDAQSLHQLSASRTDARQAVLKQYSQGAVSLQLSTPLAQWLDRGASVVFPLAVDIVEPAAQDGPLHFAGSQVTLLAARHLAISEQAVVVDSAVSHVTATGFDYDWTTGHWDLHHKVHMVYAKKR